MCIRDSYLISFDVHSFAYLAQYVPSVIASYTMLSSRLSSALYALFPFSVILYVLLRPSICQLAIKSRIKVRRSLSINPGVVKGRLPLKLYSGSDGMHVRTDENLQVFVPCGFCRPGANARGKTRENSKKWRIATFLTLSAASRCGINS